MVFYPIAPGPLLAGYVRYYWVLEGDVPPGGSYTTAPWPVAAPSSAFIIKAAAVMQGAVPLLLGIPASEINNQMIDLTSLLGRQGEVLSEKMLTAVDNRQRAGILSSFLESRLPDAGSSRVIPAIHQIIHTGGQTPIQSLSE